MSLRAASVVKKSHRPVIVRSNNVPVKARTSGQKMAMRIRPRKRLEASSQVGKSHQAASLIPFFSVSKSLIFIGVVFSLLLVKLFVRLEILDMSYKIEHARNELISQDALYRELKAHRAIDANPRKIIEEARLKLNLRPTTPQQIRRIY